MNLYLIGALVFWLAAWALNVWLSNLKPTRLTKLLVPLIFGITLLVIWEWVVRGLEVKAVLLPPPSMIWERFISDLSQLGFIQMVFADGPISFGCGNSKLCADFVQTFIKGALSGYFIGCGAAFVTAVAIDRSPFLQKGLLPVGNFVAALPIIGMAPILVMWFGFGWQSKAAVVVIMVFFPMLVNTVQGMQAQTSMQRDLMRAYAASYPQKLLKLRLPAAAPFIFNGLKISTTLALIGAIVAEFFGSPTVGMGFRISTEVGRLSLDMVWAEIVVAAIAGSAFYGVVALLEKATTFWHPSQRG
ncbi:MAG: ABC transporter permease [Paracoccaceae bacterium]|jgi:NitT/TauT family transport system permease protein